MGNHFDWEDVPRCEECQGRPCVCKRTEPTGKPTYEQLCEELLSAQYAELHLRASLSAAEKEQDELKAALNRERQLSDVKCANLAEIGYQNFHSAGATITALTDILAAIRTALGCPELPVEEVAGKVGEVVKEKDKWRAKWREERELCEERGIDLEHAKRALAASIHPKEGE